MAVINENLNDVLKQEPIGIVRNIPKDKDEVKAKKLNKSKAGRKKLGSNVEVQITDDFIKVKKLDKKIPKKKVSYSLEKSCLDIIEKRAKELNVPASKIIEIAVSAFDKKVIIE